MSGNQRRRPAIVDGANVAHEEYTEGGCPKVANIVAVREKLIEEGFEPVVIVDAALRHRIDDPDELEGLIQRQEVRQAPAGTDADFFVIATAEEMDAPIISNDAYKPYRRDHPGLDDRRIPLMIINGTVELYDRAQADPEYAPQRQPQGRP